MNIAYSVKLAVIGYLNFSSPIEINELFYYKNFIVLSSVMDPDQDPDSVSDP